MWERLSHPWKGCVEQAWQAYCGGALPIGAVVVSKSGEVIGKGRKLGGNRLAHAEVNALLAADFAEHNPSECTLFTTTEPCPFCVGAIVMANVKRFYFASRDPWSGSVELLTASNYMRRQEVKATGPENDELEILIVAIQVEAHLRSSAERSQPILDAWRSVVATGVLLGEQLFRSGDLVRMAEQNTPASIVFDHLAKSITVE
ncbi:MAG: nucleoside deaminase [Anaerolineales bacterium]